MSKITPHTHPTSLGLSAGSIDAAIFMDPADKPRDVGSRAGSGQLQSGFTLIEVLLALAIIAIALTALLKVTSQNIENTRRLKDITISHWIAMQGITMIQLNLIQINPTQETTNATTLLGEHWYWRAKIGSTPVKSMQKITISVSPKEIGPFKEELIAFRHLP